MKRSHHYLGLALLLCCWQEHKFATAWLAPSIRTSSHSPINRRRTSSSSSCRLFAAYGSEKAPSKGTGTDSSSPSSAGPPVPRRKKKNKYENFSKTDANADPFEKMIQESGQKVQQLDDEKKQNKESANPKPFIPLPPQIDYPDNKNIDPYDPATFGYVEVGIVTGAHGVHGWIKVQSTTDFPLERLCQAGIRHLKPPMKRAPRRVVLLQGKHRLEDEYLLQLDVAEDRDTAAKLRGSVLYAREEEKVTPEKEEYLVSDLVGLDVFLEQDAAEEGDTTKDTEEDSSRSQFVGKVVGIVFAHEMCSIPGLGHDMLEIVIPRGIGGTLSLRDELVLIPMVPQIVPRVDIQGRAIYVDPPTGLLDLTYVREDKVRIKGFLPMGKD
jgi:16S rRNA processing protein RimM